MKGGRGLVTVGTFAGAAVQWYLVWLAARFAGVGPTADYSRLFAVATPAFVAGGLALRNLFLTLARSISWSVWMRLRAVGMLAAAAVVVVAGAMLGAPGGLVAAVVVMKIADGTLDLLYGVLQRDSRWESLGALMVANPVASALAATVLVVATGDFTLAVLASGLVSAAVAAVAWWLARAHVGAEDGPPGHVGDVLRAALPLTIAQLLAAVLASVPVWVAQVRGSDADVAAWTGAGYLMVFGNLVGASIQTILIPGVRDLVREGRNGAALARADRATLRTVALGLVGAVVVVGLGDLVLEGVYGSGYAIGPVALELLAVGAVTNAAAFPQTAALLVLRRYVSQAVTTGAGVVAAAIAGTIAVAAGASPVVAAAVAACAGGLVRLATGLAAARRVG